MTTPRATWSTNDRIRLAIAVLLAFGILAMLAACDTASRIQTVKTAIPIACQETEPARPIMPTDRLLPGATVDAFVQASQAEIDRREGYEIKLVTALRTCIAPIAP